MCVHVILLYFIIGLASGREKRESEGWARELRRKGKPRLIILLVAQAMECDSHRSTAFVDVPPKDKTLAIIMQCK